MAATFLLHLMGCPSVYRTDPDGSHHAEPMSPASLSLLTLVAMQGGADGLSRAIIVETLWPGAAPDKVGSRLSSALHRTRCRSGTPLLHRNGSSIVLSPKARVTVDVVDLAQRTEALCQDVLADWQRSDVAALEAALSRRSGLFLEGLGGDWVMAARRRCAEIYEAGLEALIRYHRHHGHLNRSIDAARRLVRQDPYREDIQAVLVELYGRKNQPGRAAAQFASARDLLRSDLGVAPGDALRDSVDAALAGRLLKTHGRHAVSADPEVLAMLRHLDSNVAQLTRQIGEIRSLLDAKARETAAE